MAPRRSGKSKGLFSKHASSSSRSHAHEDPFESDSEHSEAETGQKTRNIKNVEPWGKSARHIFAGMVADALELYDEQWPATALAQCPEEEQEGCRDRVEELCDAMCWQLEGKRGREAVAEARREFRDWEWRIVQGLRWRGDPAKVGRAVLESVDRDEPSRRRSRRVAGKAPFFDTQDPVKLRPDDYIIDSLLAIWEALSLRVKGDVDGMSAAPFAILQ